MNNIQLALLKQNVSAAWVGPEPEGINKITKAYLDGKYQGTPRLVRDMDDTNQPIKIAKLKEDWEKISKEQICSNHSGEIKQYANNFITSVYSQQEQLNLITKSIRITAKKATKDEKAELLRICAIWDWIDTILNTANTAIEEKLDPCHVNWANPPK